MALGALAQNANVTVVPLGLNYFHAHKFRSRAVVEFGEPVAISSELVDNFKNGKRRESIGELLGSIYQSLTAVTMTAPDFDTLMVSNALFNFCLTSLTFIARSCSEALILRKKGTDSFVCRH
jgi:glycerol-3-phosphate O-acyltransferase / dihydroxyacetone phosphate acyltransferase